MEMVRVSSGFRVRTPSSRNLLPPLTHQVLPHPLCLLPAEVSTSLQKGKADNGHSKERLAPNG